MDNSNVYEYSSREFSDPLREILRNGAQELITQAVEIELQVELQKHQTRVLPNGRAAVIRNGYLPAREIQTGVGPVTVRIPKIRSHDGKAVVFRSALVPPYVRKSRSLDAAVPWLYLKGVSSGDMAEALQVLVGDEAQGFSASTVSRLKQRWAKEYEQWCQRRLDEDEWVYVWVDGIYSGLRAQDVKLCALVMIGVDAYGNKQLLAIQDGQRESTQSWRELLLDLKARGMNAPKLVVGDGAMGFWSAMDEVYPETVDQRCWVHKMANVLNAMPKSLHERAKRDLQQIWMAESRAEAKRAWQHFIDKYQAKYPRAVALLEKDREELLAFYDFPAEHWQSIRTTNPIESTFATIRHRTKRSKGCLSRNGMLHMMFKLGICAQHRWNRMRGFKMLGKVITGVRFRDGIEMKETEQMETDNRVAA